MSNRKSPYFFRSFRENLYTYSSRAAEKLAAVGKARDQITKKSKTLTGLSFFRIELWNSWSEIRNVKNE